MIRPTDISNHFPAQWRDRLVNAATNDKFEPLVRLAIINQIVDEMAAAGLCRPRNDDQRTGEAS